MVKVKQQQEQEIIQDNDIIQKGIQIDYEPDNLIEEALPEKINVQKISKAITDAIDKYLMTSIIQRKILVQELSVQDIEDQL